MQSPLYILVYKSNCEIKDNSENRKKKINDVQKKFKFCGNIMRNIDTVHERVIGSLCIKSFYKFRYIIICLAG
jgi:ethanolamine utilization cobalamin adenosyltransferase